jgi:hypothetical protein
VCFPIAVCIIIEPFSPVPARNEAQDTLVSPADYPNAHLKDWLNTYEHRCMVRFENATDAEQLFILERMA